MLKGQNLPNVCNFILVMLGSLKAGCRTTQVTLPSLFRRTGKWRTLVMLDVPFKCVEFMVLMEKMPSLRGTPRISQWMSGMGLAFEAEQEALW